MTFEGLGEMFEGYSADMGAGKFVVAENQENSKIKTRKEGHEYPGEGAAKKSAAGPF